MPNIGVYGMMLLMAVKITIKDVPEEIRDKLAALASDRGQSMQEFLHSELERIASKLSVNEWVEQVRADKETSRTRIPPDVILEAIHADRK